MWPRSAVGPSSHDTRAEPSAAASGGRVSSLTIHSLAVSCFCDCSHLQGETEFRVDGLARAASRPRREGLPDLGPALHSFEPQAFWANPGRPFLFPFQESTAMWRHGDVLIESIERIPNEVT